MRTRPHGRIGGVAGPAPDEAVRALRAALGAGAQVLDPRQPAPDLVADWDACFIDDRPVRDLAHWAVTVREGRLARVSGAFALAWREADGTLVLARDPIGERTLYYAHLPGAGLVFGSTLRALLATGLVPRTLDLPAVAAYLSYAYVPGPATLVQGARELGPGEMVRFAAGGPVSTPLWSLPAEPAPDAAGAEGPDEAALRGRLRAALEGAVARRLPAGDPVGATLSGGLDSSLVVALAGRLSDRPVHTYSIHFGAPYPNELAWSGLVAEHCRTRHRVVELSPAAILQDLDATIALLSDPIGDPLTVPNALVFRAAAADVGVVLNGEGGDPCFGGPKNLPMILAALLGDGGDGGGGGLEASYLRAHGKCYDDLGSMLAPGARAALAARPLEGFLTPYFRDPRWPRFVTRLQAMNVALKGAHHILHKIDEVSAPAGVLPRSPLFDQAVVEAAFAIPPELKLRGSVEKYLLKQAVADLLPPAILERPKSGMLVPVEGWFRGQLLPHARERLLDGLAPYALFDRPWLERLLAGRLGGLRPRHGAKIWLLVTLEAWLRTVLARAGAV